jgi:FkbM family methyltransferase
MNPKMNAPIALDPDGFNELRMCRTGPMLYNKNDIYIGGALRKYGEFSWLEREMFAQLVRPGQIVVEAGANIGTHTVSLSKLVGRRGAVLAFEPQRIVFQALCANLALNQCSNVAAYQEALGAADSDIVAPAPDPAVRASFGSLSLHGVAQGNPVRLRRLDSLGLPLCHLLKIDVEGMEAEVLEGARDTIARLRPTLYLENDRPDHSRELIQRVFDLGYDAFWHLPPLYNPDNFAGDAEDIFPGLLSANMLCTPSEHKVSLAGVRKVRSPDDGWKS